MKSVKYNTLLILTALFLTVILFSTLPGISYAAESNVTVDVNISTLLEITITPAAINWTQITPGVAGGMRNLTIQNTGSGNITSVYAYVTTLDNETVRPYTSSSAGAYSASGVLVFHNNSDSRFYWAGRLEWNWTESIVNLVWPSQIDSGSRVSQGFFRNASNSFVWAVGNGTSGWCNDTGTKLALVDRIDEGTTDTRAPTTTGITMDASDANYSYFSVNRAGNFLDGMCVAVNQYCNQVYAYKYDKRAAPNTFSACANSQTIIANMVPSQTEKVTADVYIPRGMPAGDMKQAIWVFRAS